ncbi:MAG: bifunctional hydroxymethylpyrimidine kinase/phosphomethylpyrimidine kinase [Armatimonadota bacterium]
MRAVLTIAGSDSSGGAGIQADLKVFQSLGVYGLSTVTAVTAQNSRGVHKVNKVPPRIIAAQIDAVTRDIGADACKIGMLYTLQAVTVVADRIARRKLQNVVLDPIIFAKDGTRLLLAKAVQRLRRDLIPRSTLVTPNVIEAAELARVSIADQADAKSAAKIIHGFGPKYVLIKGGHFSGEPVDLLYDGKQFIEYPGERIDGPPMHGTGCVLSAAIAARLALGDSVPDAVRFAKDYVTAAIKNSVVLGKGCLSYFTGNSVI